MRYTRVKKQQQGTVISETKERVLYIDFEVKPSRQVLFCYSLHISSHQFY